MLFIDGCRGANIKIRVAALWVFLDKNMTSSILNFGKKRRIYILQRTEVLILEHAVFERYKYQMGHKLVFGFPLVQLGGSSFVWEYYNFCLWEIHVVVSIIWSEKTKQVEHASNYKLCRGRAGQKLLETLCDDNLL